ncbi:ATP12 family chaperone protein [Phenylobacterium sp.]|uniref:ATP12 family chaperone protein n=1 Tax=Phenylobacterium sp. TaxID=1871053 RepID=UPI0027257F1B|nr:ATP12 family protein [Phenylobacterium sp.]MDO8377384.1 ATP12 family protein [Phenylobacterium sp.]
MAKGFKEAGEKPRRFYKQVAVAPDDGGFAVMLDNRNLRTPKAALMVLPTRALADLVAVEWAAQGDHIELAVMHATRLANTALDAIPAAREGTADQIAQYAGSDLLCYYAQDPAVLLERQVRHWEPVLERAEHEFDVAFVRAAGIVHQSQPEQTLAKVKAMALTLDDFGLAGVAFGTALFGSAVLAFGLSRGWMTGIQALELSRLDEIFQEEKWGIDDEAAERTARHMVEAQMLERWFKALG